jgi:hypothetical protein
MAFGIENCTYRHCRLPEDGRALDTSAAFISMNRQSTAQRQFHSGRVGHAVI